MKKKILFIAPGNSIHSKRWVEHFKNDYEIFWISFHEFREDITMDKNKLSYIKYNFINIFKIIFQVHKLCKLHKPKIIHIHSVSKYLILSSLLIIKQNRMKNIIATVWGSDYKLASTLVRKLITNLLKKIKLVTTDSFEIFNNFKSININVEKINFGIDTDFFYPSQQKHEKILVNPRGFENVYSPYTFLKAINNIKNKICNLQFVIIGDGPEKVNIDKYILKNNLKGLITVKSKLNFIEYLNLIHKSMGMVSCSLSDAGISSSIAEFMSCNKIIIATNNSDNSYWINDKVNGFLFENENSDQLSDILLKLDKNINGTTFENRELIVKNNNYQDEMLKIKEIYENI